MSYPGYRPGASLATAIARRVLYRLPDYEQMRHASAAVVARVLRGTDTNSQHGDERRMGLQPCIPNICRLPVLAGHLPGNSAVVSREFFYVYHVELYCWSIDRTRQKTVRIGGMAYARKSGGSRYCEDALA